jgi:hypothetical protein
LTSTVLTIVAIAVGVMIGRALSLFISDGPASPDAADPST